MPSFILIRPTVWPQYTNVTDRQTGQTGETGQRTDSIGRTVLQTVAQKCTYFTIHRELLVNTDSQLYILS